MAPFYLSHVSVLMLEKLLCKSFIGKEMHTTQMSELSVQSLKSRFVKTCSEVHVMPPAGSAGLWGCCSLVYEDILQICVFSNRGENTCFWKCRMRVDNTSVSLFSSQSHKTSAANAAAAVLNCTKNLHLLNERDSGACLCFMFIHGLDFNLSAVFLQSRIKNLPQKLSLHSAVSKS